MKRVVTFFRKMEIFYFFIWFCEQLECGCACSLQDLETLLPTAHRLRQESSRCQMGRVTLLLSLTSATTTETTHLTVTCKVLCRCFCWSVKELAWRGHVQVMLINFFRHLLEIISASICVNVYQDCLFTVLSKDISWITMLYLIFVCLLDLYDLSLLFFSEQTLQPNRHHCWTDIVNAEKY